MRSERFTLAVDLDGVVADLTRGLKPIAAKWLGLDAQDLSEEVSYGFPEWGLAERGGFDALHRFAVSEHRLFARLPQLRGAQSALRSLSESGLRIRIVTHRLHSGDLRSEIVAQTVGWLNDHSIPFDDLCFIDQKSEVEADLFVEDAPVAIRELRAAGRETIVFAQPWNREFSAPRADSWMEVQQLVVSTARRLTSRCSGPTTARFN
jgi:5'(3')-deoxyribonucleotidase